MPLFSYIGLDPSGEEYRGSVEAESEREVVRILRDQSLIPVKIREGEEADLDQNVLAMARRLLSALVPTRFLPVGKGDLIVFFRQMALMLRAGYTLVSALEACAQMQTKYRLRHALNKAVDQLHRGESFSASLAESPRLFPPMTTNLLVSGEQSGNLEAILERLADNMEQTKELKRQLISAMFYPCFVLISSLGVVVVMVMWVVPKFAAFLAARNAELPPATQLLMDVSDWAVAWGKPLGGGLAGLIFAVLAAYTTPAGKRTVDRLILGIPVVGKAVLYAAMAQAGWAISILLKSGVTALEALRITSGVIGNLAVSECFSRAADGLLEGQALSRTFDQKHFPPMMRHMAAVGESSGQLDIVMNDVGEFFQKELVAKVKMLSVMVEPVLIVMVGALVFYVYYALFSAVMSVSKGGM